MQGAIILIREFQKKAGIKEIVVKEKLISEEEKDMSIASLPRD